MSIILFTEPSEASKAKICKRKKNILKVLCGSWRQFFRLSKNTLFICESYLVYQETGAQ